MGGDEDALGLGDGGDLGLHPLVQGGELVAVFLRVGFVGVGPGGVGGDEALFDGFEGLAPEGDIEPDVRVVGVAAEGAKGGVIERLADEDDAAVLGELLEGVDHAAFEVDADGEDDVGGGEQAEVAG